MNSSEEYLHRYYGEKTDYKFFQHPSALPSPADPKRVLAEKTIESASQLVIHLSNLLFLVGLKQMGRQSALVIRAVLRKPLHRGAMVAILRITGPRLALSTRMTLSISTTIRS